MISSLEQIRMTVEFSLDISSISTCTTAPPISIIDQDQTVRLFIWNSIFCNTENILVALHSEAPSHPSGSDEDQTQKQHKDQAALSAICPT